jgi:hypothetical protein
MFASKTISTKKNRKPMGRPKAEGLSSSGSSVHSSGNPHSDCKTAEELVM